MAGKTFLRIATAVAVLGVMSACDNGPSAVAQNPAPTTSSSTSRAFETQTTMDDRRSDPAPTIGGKPVWTANRRFSAEENAKRAFARNGEDFGAASVEDFVRKAHDFVSHPPAGTDRLVRANGDVLLYDPKGNVFAVVSKAGAPRTMFKPDAGPAYWAEQKAREQQRQTARSEKARGDGEG